MTATTPAPENSTQSMGGAEENLRSLHPSALRERMPEAGLQEYWYPALYERKVSHKKPTKVTLLGKDLIFFRGKSGQVVSTAAVCPHRGASLARGTCHFSGTITCPYHGWTFNEDGKNVAVLGEGPESRIPGMPDANVRSYPTLTLKGIVWVWMGTREPAPPEEDIPPQFFDDEWLVQASITAWKCNWRPAFENLLDSHVFYVHRNSVHMMMMDPNAYTVASKMGPRRPRPRVINGRALSYPPGALGFLSAFVGGGDKKAKAWPPQDGQQLQDSYPGLDGQLWPLSDSRLLWHRAYGAIKRLKLTKVDEPIVIDPEWKDAHLPATFQVGYPDHIYSRVTVPIDAENSRIFYFHSTRPRSAVRNLWDRLYFEVFQNWMMNYNFSGQDAKVVEHQAYDTPETFSATDVFPLTLRRLVLENARDFNPPAKAADWPTSTESGHSEDKSSQQGDA